MTALNEGIYPLILINPESGFYKTTCLVNFLKPISKNVHFGMNPKA